MSIIISGTLILAEQVYKTADGKWIVCGTYNTIYTRENPCVFSSGIMLYLRLHTDRAGVVRGRISIEEMDADPRAHADGRHDIMSAEFSISVPPEHVPIMEGSLILPSSTIGIQGDMPAGPVSIVKRMMIRLAIDQGEGQWRDLTISPLAIVFNLGSTFPGEAHGTDDNPSEPNP